MTAAAVRQLRPGLGLGCQVAAAYALRDTLGRRMAERHVVGPLVRVDWISPTVFAATIHNIDGLNYKIDSRNAEVTPC